MSDDSPIGNIRQQLDESDKQKEDAKVDKKPEQEEENEESEGGQSFPFSEAKQSPLYPHQDRWEELDDAKFKMEGFLRKQGIRNLQGRELDNAILQHAIANPEAVANLVMRARGIEADTDED